MDNNNQNSATLTAPTGGWLRSLPFDLTLIVAVAGLALLFGGATVAWPQLFGILLFIDIWFLGSPHVIATFSRIAFDSESFKQNKFLVLVLPFIVAFGAVSAAFTLGPWILATTYLYWQWFHYTRQSYGIARVYQLKADPESKAVDKGIIYGLPLLGILWRSYQNPGSFLGLELKVLPVPYFVIQIVGVYVAVTLCRWAIHQYRNYKSGKLSLPFFMFMISHIVIFWVGYIDIKNINAGWLVLNVWHNAQYILFVWMFNNKKFKNNYNPKHKLISLISLNKNHWLFYGVCLAFSFLFYGGISKMLGIITLASFPMLSVAVYQTINFHHYIVDGIIWKVRQKPVRNNLGISG